MFFKPYGYTNEIYWWDIVSHHYDPSTPESGESLITGYKWCLHPSILWENECSYSSRKDGHIENINPYLFHETPQGVEWENQRSITEFFRQLKVLTPYNWKWIWMNPIDSISFHLRRRSRKRRSTRRDWTR